MKDNKIYLSIIILALLLVTIFLSINVDNGKYTVKVSMVDDKSPDRTLKVYDDKNKEVEFLEIRYLDDVVLCTSKNPTVYYGDIENIEKVRIVLKNNKKVVAKIEEVKKWKKL